MQIISNEAWIFFLADGYLEEKIDENATMGKWMFFFNSSCIEAVEDICAKAIEQKVLKECKCSNPDGAEFRLYDNSQGVACFYCDYNDEAAHKRILKYFIENNLIRKTKSGKLYNVSFKLDEQTENGEYGKDFKGAIKLDRFVDLTTGKFK